MWVNSYEVKYIYNNKYNIQQKVAQFQFAQKEI